MHEQVRAHSIVDASPNALILADVFNVNLPQQSGTSDKSKEGESESAEAVKAMETNDSDRDQVTEVSRDADVDEALEIYKNLMDGTISAEEASQSDVLVRIKGRLQKHIESIKKTSRTSALWMQYMDMQDILRKYIACRAHWKLAITSAGYPGHATLSGSISTPNLLGCIFNRCKTSRPHTQESINISRKGST